MIHQLIPWFQLTRGGIPPMKVARRPLTLGEVIVPVGEALDPELIPFAIRSQRLRQFYEQRRLEPVDPPPTSQQYYREKFIQMHGGDEAVIEPIKPVASQIVAGPELPTVEVPVEEEPPKRKKGAK